MISKLAASAATFFANNDVYSHEKINVYQYGFQVLISSAANVICVLAISILTGSVLSGLIFLLAFVPLRMTAGGYHAKHHWSCIWGFNVIFFGFSMLCKNLSEELLFFYTPLAIVISALMVMLFSPVEAINKPLKEEKKKRNRRYSLMSVGINAALAIFACFIPNAPGRLIASYASGALASGVLLPIANYANKKARQNSGGSH